MTRLYKPVRDLGFTRTMTSPLRALPDFLIIGAQKCGTSTLFESLMRHSCVARPLWKEVHFFDIFYNRGIRWYRGCFDSRLHRLYTKLKFKKNIITGESTPYYLYHPLAPQRIFRALPKAKMIVLLRNPIDRAYSHYNMMVRMGLEELTFEQAVKSEEKRLSGEREKILKDKNYYSFNDMGYSYLTRGIYVDQLKTWMNHYPKENFLILKTEDFNESPQKILDQTFDFLSLPRQQIKYEKHNVGVYSDMTQSTRKELMEFFKSHNEKLYKFLDMGFGWN